MQQSSAHRLDKPSIIRRLAQQRRESQQGFVELARTVVEQAETEPGFLRDFIRHVNGDGECTYQVQARISVIV